MGNENTPTLRDRVQEGIDLLNGRDKRKELDNYELTARFEFQRAIKAYDEAWERIDARKPGYKFDWSTMHNMVAAEVSLDLWARVAARMTTDNDERRLSAKDAITEVAKSRLQDIIGNYNRPSSTSPFSNAADIVKQEVDTQFVRNFAGDLKVSDARLV